MSAKRKPTKPVKAWIVIDDISADPDRNFLRAISDRAIFLTRDTARVEKASYERIARVEIREVGR